eukprot:m.92767 g.92767  ORF g.92767 m.92767 type:complete len:904 (-) comp14962_c0_seq2:87-2798(-)
MLRYGCTRRASFSFATLLVLFGASQSMPNCVDIPAYPNGNCNGSCLLECSIIANTTAVRPVHCINGSFEQEVCTISLCQQCDCRTSVNAIELRCARNDIKRFPLAWPLNVTDLVIRANVDKILHLNAGLRQMRPSLSRLVIDQVDLPDNIDVSSSFPNLRVLDMLSAGDKVTTAPLLGPMLEVLALKRNTALRFINLTNIQQRYPLLRRLQFEPVPVSITGSFLQSNTLQDVTVTVADCDEILSLGLQNLTDVMSFTITCGVSSATISASYLPAVGQLRRAKILVLSTEGFKYVSADVVSTAMNYSGAWKDPYDPIDPEPVYIGSLYQTTCVSRISRFVHNLNCTCAESNLKGAAFCPRLYPMQCYGSAETIETRQLCDGVEDCSNGADEQFCAGVFQAVIPPDFQLSSLATTLDCYDNMPVTFNTGLSYSPPDTERVCLALHGVALGATHGEGQAGRGTMRVMVIGKQIQAVFRVWDTDTPTEPVSIPMGMRLVEGALMGLTVATSDLQVSWPENITEFNLLWEERERQQREQDWTAESKSTPSPTEAKSESKGNTSIIVIAVVSVVLVLVVAVVLVRHRYVLHGQTGNTAVLAKALTDAQAGFQDQHPHLQYYPINLLDRNQLVLGKLLGQGQFSRVVAAQLKIKHQPGLTVAVKQQSIGLEQLQAVLQELFLLQTMSQHQHIVTVLGFVQDSILEGISLTVMEYAELGNLKAYVKRQQNEWLAQDTIQALAQIAKAMAWLAQHRVVHRDLALRNVLLFQADPLICKLADFGLSRPLADVQDYYKSSSLENAPIRSCAPECLTKRQFSTQSDVWAFGVLVYELTSNGTTPYADLSLAEIAKYIKSGGDLALGEQTDRWMKMMCQQCWAMAPEQRPAFPALVRLLQSKETCFEQSIYDESSL